MIDSKVRKKIQFFFDILALYLLKMKLTPNIVTVLAFIMGIFSAVMVLFGYYFASLCLLWLSGLMDILDGSMARLSRSSSTLGAFLHLIFDRLVEVFFIILFALAHPQLSIATMVFLGTVIFNFSTFMLAGSLFKNESEKGMHYDSGLIERTETFIIFSIMLIMPQYSYFILWGFNLLILWTGILRFFKIIRFVSNEEKHL